MRRCSFLAAVALSLLGCDRKTAAPPVAGTAPPPGVVRYLIGGDSRDDASHVLPWAFREAVARRATAFFFLGDMELTPQLDEHFRDALTLLGPVAFYPALGNHEVRLFGEISVAHDKAEADFRKRFLETPATPIHSSLPNKVVYSVTLAGGVHFIALDNVSQKGFGPEQLAWLESDLDKTGKDTTVHVIIVGMHKPLAHNGRTTHSMEADGPGAVADSDAALRLLVRYHASMIVASHLHAYLPLEVSGIPMYITGGLGAPLDLGGPDYAFHHFLQVDVTKTGFTVDVVRFDGKSSMGDGTDRD